MKKYPIAVLLLSLLLSFSINPAAAEDLGAIKSRMIERLPELVKLKKQGFVGENNQGYLEFVGAERHRQDLVKAENRDRKLVYEAIAKQQGTAPEVVGKHRAAQIHQKAQPGEWLQGAEGKWYKK
jgi:uncharacterized protein YdbL (DUF1318 family)